MSRKRKDPEKYTSLTDELNSEDDFYKVAEEFISSYLDLLDLKQKNDETGREFEELLVNKIYIINFIIRFILENINLIIHKYFTLYYRDFERIGFILSSINMNFQYIIPMIEYKINNNNYLDMLRDKLFRNFRKQGLQLPNDFKTMFKKESLNNHELFLIFKSLEKFKIINIAKGKKYKSKKYKSKKYKSKKYKSKKYKSKKYKSKKYKSKKYKSKKLI